MLNISIFGTGYVGLVSGTCFAEIGHKVECVDISADRIKLLKKGKSPIYEPGLDKLISRNIANQKLSFSKPEDINIDKTDLIFICVGTPSRDDGSCDLSFVEQCCDDISNKLSAKKIVIIKSTVPVGTCSKMSDRINSNLANLKKKFKISVSSNPEFLREGNAVFDFMNPDRVIVGINDDNDKEIFNILYQPILKKDQSIIFMSTESSESTKYAANTMLAMRISFMNELSRFANYVNASIDSIKEGIGSDERIGPHFLNSGLGYGGSCFPKDVDSLIDQMNKAGINSSLLEAVREINFSQPSYYLDNLINNKVKSSTLTIWGFTFKPDTDDYRETPALKIIENYYKQVKEIKVYDPFYKSNNPVSDRFDNVIFCDDKYEALFNANLLILVTDWTEFKNIDYLKVKEIMSEARIFDGRNLLSDVPDFISYSSINNYKKI